MRGSQERDDSRVGHQQNGLTEYWQIDEDAVVRKLSGLIPHLWAIAIVFFGVGDLLTTVAGLHFERVIEVGPIAAILYEHFGLASLGLLKLATFAVLFLVWRLIPPPHDVGVPLGLATLGVLVTGWNLSVIIALL